MRDRLGVGFKPPRKITMQIGSFSFLADMDLVQVPIPHQRDTNYVLAANLIFSGEDDIPVPYRAAIVVKGQDSFGYYVPGVVPGAQLRIDWVIHR